MPCCCQSPLICFFLLRSGLAEHPLTGSVVAKLGLPELSRTRLWFLPHGLKQGKQDLLVGAGVAGESYSPPEQDLHSPLVFCALSPCLLVVHNISICLTAQYDSAWLKASSSPLVVFLSSHHVLQLAASHHSAEHRDLCAAELSASNCTAPPGSACLKSFLYSVICISYHCSCPH